MLSEQQEKAIYLLVYDNLKRYQVAEEVGVHGSTVSKWFKNADFTKKYDEEMHNKFNDLQAKAISRMNELIDCESPTAAYNASKYVLDYKGFKATDKQEVKHEGLKITIDYGDSGGDAECQKQ